MPHNLNSGYLSRWLAAQSLRGEVSVAKGLTALALALEAKAKDNASDGAHDRRSHTPASPGSGPAVITGDLRRSITHTPVVPVGGILQARVGPADTPHSKSSPGARSSTTSGKIGMYLETGLRNGSTYPFLGPAFDDVIPGHVDGAMHTAWDTSPVEVP